MSFSYPISAMEQTLQESYCVITSFVLILYDTVITSDREIEYIWHCRISGVTVIYLLNRYAYLLSAFMNIWSWLGPQTTSSCYAYQILFDITTIVALFSTALFTSFRIWAIWGRQWLPLILTLIVTLVPSCANLYFHSTYRFQGVFPLPVPFGGCIWKVGITANSSTILGFITRLSAIIGDTLVLIATWLKTAHIWKGARNAGRPVSLVNLLIRDGSLYFGAILVFNLLTLAFNFQFFEINPGTEFLGPLTSILISRFILNLRSLGDIIADNNTTTGALYLTTVLGNIGAPLSHDYSYGWRFVDSISVQQAIDDPLSIGLFSTAAGKRVPGDLESSMCEAPSDHKLDDDSDVVDISGMPCSPNPIRSPSRWSEFIAAGLHRDGRNNRDTNSYRLSPLRASQLSPRSWSTT